MMINKKTTGGRNGYGAKLANIFSNKFIVETYDPSVKKYYKQIWTNNMTQTTLPIIKTCKKKESYTKITFYPDFNKFGMLSLDADILALFKKRVYDIAGTTDKNLKVYYNGINYF